MTQYSWVGQILKVEPDYYREKNRPVQYAFSNGRVFRGTLNIDPDLYLTADSTMITADNAYYTADAGAAP